MSRTNPLRPDAGPLHPLSSSDLDSGWTPLAQANWRACLLPFVEAGVVGGTELQVVDLLARRAGETRPEVLLALCLAVRAPVNGHVCATLPDLGVDNARERLPLPADPEHPPLPWPMDRALWRAAVGTSPLVGLAADDDRRRPFVLHQHRLYPRRTWVDEHRLAALLDARAAASMPPHDAGLLRSGLRALFPPHEEGTPVDRQLLAATMACLRGFSVISGGPGTGKTWTVRNVLTLLFAQHLAGGSDRPLRVAVGAPTGKAAARVQESLAGGLSEFVQDRGAGALPPGSTPAALEGFLSSLGARTVHRLLRVDPRRPGRFRHGPDNPMPVDVVVIDETSMLDLALMTRLVEAVPEGARLVLLGDHHQLASVDAGCVLADLCTAAGFDQPRLSQGARDDLASQAGIVPGPDIGLAHAPGLHDCGVQLTVSRRFHARSGIGAVARAVLAGEPGSALEVLQDPNTQDVRWVEATGGPTRALAQAVVQGYAPVVRRLLAGAHAGDPAVFHARMLAAFDGFRLLCAHRRGRLGVSGLVKLTEQLLARTVRGFDPRGQHYLGRPVLVTRNDYGVGRYNGDVGLVVERDGRRMVVFPDAERGVRYLAPARLPPHETVFAMTIHKSQGSEFDHAMVVLPSSAGPLLTRELVYTGATRARKRLTVAGTPSVWSEAVHRRVARASGLSDLLMRE